MAFGRVLAVVTGDPSDAAVVERAADLVRSSKGQLVTLYVIRVDRGLPVDADVPPAVAKGEDVLRGVEQRVKLPKGDVAAELLQARELGPAVVQEALVRGVDAIVVGTSYRREYGSFSLGADIPYILEHAPCTVMLWREAPERGGRVAGDGAAPPPRRRGPRE
ncbi:MAG: universal stress protein [Gemmatimonadetes bacterium]|nr:universal stress protein [Gemmatimonadota bacterium]